MNGPTMRRVDVRQRAAHREVADVDAARHDHEIDRVGGGRVAGGRVLAGKKLMRVLPRECPARLMPTRAKAMIS